MFTKDKAIIHFQDRLVAFQRSSLALVASAALCMIAGTRGKEDERRTFAEMTSDLRELIGTTGVKQAMTYKYISLSQQLVKALTTDENKKTLDGIIACKAPNAAEQVIHIYFDKNNVGSLDDLSAFLGGNYQRSDAGTTTVATNRVGQPGIATVGNNRKRTERVLTEELTATPVEVVGKAVASSADPVGIMTEMCAMIEDVKLLREMAGVIEGRLSELTSTPRRKTPHHREAAIRMVA